MRARLLPILVLLIPALLPAVPAAAQEAGVELTVIGPDGEPVPDVQVRWDAGDVAQTRVAWTDANGTVVVWHEGTVAVRFESAQGHAIQWLGGTPGRSGSTTLELRGGRWLEPQEVHVEEGGALAGTARLTDGSPAAYACALVRTPGGDLVTRAWAGGDGRWETRPVLLAGRYVVEFQHCASPTTWGWHGGTSLETAAQVHAVAGGTTDGVDAVLDSAARPPDARGRPSTAAELEATIDQLNRWRALMGLQPVAVDPVMAEGARLHSRYAYNTPDATPHDEDPANPWFTVEGMIAARTSEGGHLVGLTAAPFHWLPYADPWAQSVGGGDWISPAGDIVAGNWHARVARPADPPGRSPVQSWPVHWPADGMVTPLRAHWGEWPGGPADACPGYLDAAEPFPMGMPAIVQYDPFGEQVEVVAHEVHVDGNPVASCAFGPGGYTHDDPEVARWFNESLAAQNAVMVLPREQLPESALVRTTLQTNLGSTTWTYETGVDERVLGAALAATPGTVATLGGEPAPRQAAIALSQALFGVNRWGAAVSPARVVLCREDLFADCLATTPLLDWQSVLLLTAPGPDAPLPAELRAELERLRALSPGTAMEAIVVGGRSAVSDAQLNDLAALGFDARRYSGGDRTATAAMVAEQVGFFASEVLLARADDWADAITAGAYAAATHTPVLLTAPDSLSQPTRAWLESAAGIPVRIVGGTAAVAKSIEEELRARGHDVLRIAGGSRVETAILVAKLLWQRTGATSDDGFSFVDTFDPAGWSSALLAAELAARVPAPVLVSGASPPAAVTEYLDEVVTVPTMGFTFGGGAAAGADILQQHLSGCAREPGRPRCDAS